VRRLRGRPALTIGSAQVFRPLDARIRAPEEAVARIGLGVAVPQDVEVGARRHPTCWGVDGRDRIRATASGSGHYACVSGILPYILIGAIAVLGVAMSFVAGPRCQRRVAEWATHNNFRLQGAVRRRYTTGPWGLWGSGRGTRFFEVTVVDAAGTTRRGWVRIGIGLAGIGTGKLDVRWNE
jgi:hypothetical protein